MRPGRSHSPTRSGTPTLSPGAILDNIAAAFGEILAIKTLLQGFDFIAVLIGLFAFSQLLIHDVIPSPTFIRDEPVLAYSIFIAFFLAIFSAIFPWFQSQRGKHRWTLLYMPLACFAVSVPLYMMGGIPRPVIATIVVLLCARVLWARWRSGWKLDSDLSEEIVLRER